MRSFRLSPRYKVTIAGATTVFVAAVAVQGLATAQAERLGYVQANCPAVVQQAIDTLSSQCSKTASGNVCYGNAMLTAALQPGVVAGPFNAPGDTLDVGLIRQLTLGSMDVTANTWGMAELRVKADLPNTDPSQFVTMVMFGATQLTDAANDANAAVLTQTPGALARQDTYLTATNRAIDQRANVAGTRIATTSTKLAGLENTATARAGTPTATGTIPAYKATYGAATATKLAGLLNTATAIPTTTPIVPPALNGPFNGLSAFYFQSVDSAPCQQAPHDGLLIQSPQGIKQRVTLSIDGATLSIGSTVYITAQAGQFLTINTLEGSAIVTVNSRTEIALEGSAVRVPIDPALHASGPPVLIPNLYYDADSIRSLPLGTLPQSIVPVPGLPVGSSLGNGIATLSRTYTTTGLCGVPVLQQYVFPVTLAGDPQAVSLRLQIAGYNLYLPKAADGSYQGTQTIPVADRNGHLLGNGTAAVTLRFVDSLHLTGTFGSVFTNGCTVSQTLTIDLSSPANFALTKTPATDRPPVFQFFPTKTPTPTFTFTPSLTPSLTRTYTPSPTLRIVRTYLLFPTATPTTPIIS